MRHKYSQKDMEIIANAIYSIPKKKDAFEQAAIYIEVSPRAVESFYYNNKDYINHLISILEEEDIKKEYEEAYMPWYKKLWNSIISIFKKNK